MVYYQNPVNCGSMVEMVAPTAPPGIPPSCGGGCFEMQMENYVQL